ncbi:MAG: hypothetical protein ACTSPH_07275 [Promethearchaeota archaeon]
MNLAMKRFFKKYRYLLILFFLLSVTILITNFNHNSNNATVQYSKIGNETPQVSLFSKDDYSPILTRKDQGLGNVTVSSFSFSEQGFFNYTTTYPDLDDDLVSGALKMKYKETKYINTVQIASHNNIDDSAPDSNLIIITLNDSISVEYNHSVSNSEGYLIYGLRLNPVKITQVSVKNATSNIITQLSEDQYDIDELGFLKFNYYAYYKKLEYNFTLNVIYQFNITLVDWDLNQIKAYDIFIKHGQQDFQATFSYTFNILGYKHNSSSLNEKVPADNAIVNLRVNLPDKELLFDHILEIDNNPASNFLNPDKSINCTTSLNLGYFNLNFTTNFTIKFDKMVTRFWSIDRLVKGNDIRERIYLPSIISGPTHIFVKYLAIHEESITFDQVLSNSSIFKRKFAYYDANVTIIQEELQNSLIFTKNSLKKKGLKIILPYILKGECVPFIIRYKTNKNLRIVVTDNIYMPIMNLRVKLYYYSKSYGTYISKDYVIPMAPAITNEYGEVIIKDVPNGNFTVYIYSGDQLLTKSSVNPFIYTNYIPTDIAHFPIWIIIFGTINGIIAFIGILIHLSNKKRK